MEKLTKSEALKEAFPCAESCKTSISEVLKLLPRWKKEVEAFDALNNRFLAQKGSVEKSKGKYVSKEVQEIFEELCEKGSFIDMLIKREKLATAIRERPGQLISEDGKNH